MEITINSCGRNESKLTAAVVSQQHQAQQQQQQERCSPTQPPISSATQSNSSSSSTNNNTNSSDLKYLHKKFKRIASATLTNHDDSGNSSSNSNSINTSGSESKPVVAITSAPPSAARSSNTVSGTSSSSISSSTIGNATRPEAAFVTTTTTTSTSATVPAPVQCANNNESRSELLVNSAHEYPSLLERRPTTVDQQQRHHHIAAPIDENIVIYSRHQLTPSSAELQQQQQSINSSNGASLNCANDIISDSHSFISGDLIPRPSEELKPYYPSVNNNNNSSATINLSLSDSSERNRCASHGSSTTSRSSTLSPPESNVRLSSSYDGAANSLTFATIAHQQQQHHNHHLVVQNLQTLQQFPPRPPYDGSNQSSLPYTLNNHNNNSSSSPSPNPSGAGGIPAAQTNVPAPGRYVCPFCQMNCSKPSVLEKHIRRHTNERPFRCDPCGIAFKTKSNLYKHCRSRAHASKSQGEDLGPVLDEEGSLGGSDIDDKELSNSGSEIINRNSPMDDRIHSPQLLVEKPYKPKFHNAALYTKFDATRLMSEKFGVSGQQQLPGNGPYPTNYSQSVAGNQPGALPTGNSVHPGTPTAAHAYLNGQNVESLEQHISKLISDNEAIVEVVEAPLQKKYHKITGITRGISVTSSAGQQGPTGSESSSSSSGSTNNARIANALLLKQQQQHQQRLNEELLMQQHQHHQQQLVQLHQPYAPTNLVPSEQNVIIISNRIASSQAKPVTQLPVVVPQNHVMVQPSQIVSRSPNRGPEVVQYQQPLNLSKPVVMSEAALEMDHFRKRANEMRFSREPSPAPSTAQFHQASPAPVVPPSPQIQPSPVNDHPQNPEKSIIKDLLLNSERFGIVQNPENENLENLFTCKSCNTIFRNAEALKYHTICHCEGNSSALNSPSSSAPISPVGSPSMNFFRSRMDRYNPTSLKTLARVSLNPPAPKTPCSLSKLAKSKLKGTRGQRPDNISVLSKESGSSSSSMAAGPSHTPVSSVSPAAVVKVMEAVQNPLPSPGPLLGNTRLVDFQSSSKPESSKAFQESNVISHVQSEKSPVRKRSVYMNEDQLPQSPRRVQNHPSLQLFGGNMEVIDRTEELPAHRYTSGGTVTRIAQDVDKEMNDSVRMGMHSGGSFLHLPKPGRSDSTSPGLPVNAATSKLVVTITPTLTPNFYSNHQHQSTASSESASNITHFHFPPINAITAFNPLTLPQVSASPGQATQIMHAGKLIPYVQGMPGPNSMASEVQLHVKSSPRITPIAATSNNVNPTVLQSISISTGNHHHLPMVPGQNTKIQSPSLLSIVKPSSVVPPVKNGLHKEIWSPAKQDLGYNVPPKKSFNFTRIADNLSPRKKDSFEPVIKKEEIRHFNFENLISKSEIIIKTPVVPTDVKMEQPEPKFSLDVQPQPISGKAKFLRPNSLPLKPGTFTPKRHHGITPTNNTMPLISPETPRPSKSCRELYFNGHAYTNIGLKSSTKPFYCTVNKTQPFYVQTQKQLSMYSNWQVHPENDPHPLGLKPIAVMALYNSTQQRNHQYSIAASTKPSLSVVNSSSASVCVMTTMEAKTNFPTYQPPPFPSPNSANSSLQQAHLPPHLKQSFVGLQQFTADSFPPHPPRSESSERTLSGGFESTEEYTYVRGRGRGKYVCKECGIRCKKPSMLKKHIRTHTDVRPYSCQHCNFHFKTKGNLTKHMKSKSHFKKCTELGLNPIPTMVDDDGMDVDIEGDQQSISSERTSTIPGDSDTGSDSDGEDSGDESDESKSRLPEHEAAHCLLSLSMTPPTSSQQPASSKSYPSPMSYHLQQQQYHQEQRNRVAFSPLSSSSAGQLELHLHSPQQHPLLPGESQPNRRIITFANTPKVEFKLDQYYDDPNLSKKQFGKEDDGAMPIDLTKKPREALEVGHRQQQQLVNRSQQVIVRVSDVVTPITGTANLLTTLVSNTDKIPINPHGFIPNGKDQLLVGDNNEYFQEYIKQRALQDTRMKQCQMKVSGAANGADAGVNQAMFEEHQLLPQSPMVIIPEVVPPPKVAGPPEKPLYRMINGGRSLERKPPVELIASPAVVSSGEVMVPTEVGPVKPQNVPTFSNREEIVGPKEAVIAESLAESTSVSRLDNVAEVPAVPSSEPVTVGVQRPRSDSVKNTGGTPTVSGAAIESSNEGAKNVASEFLKLAAKTVSGIRKREDSESGTASDQETLAVPSPKVNPIVAPVVVVPSPANPTAGESLDRGAIVAARTVVVGEDGFKSTPAGSEFSSLTHFQDDGGRPVCEICHKKFHKISQLKIHMNIHYMERKFRCEPCGTSFRSQGLFLKHERSATHRNKVSMTTTFGIATDSNPRPFYCRDCDVGFRIHGHLAKHLRSKMHVLKLECLGKLPFGTYTEIERSGTNLTEIDTTDCENSLSSLKMLAIRLNVKDPANILPGGGSTTGDEAAGGNETDSCDDNQYADEEDDSQQDETGDDQQDDLADSDHQSQPSLVVANNNHLKRKPDEGSTTTGWEEGGGSDPKRARPEGSVVSSQGSEDS
ncbi:uncharacterized protein LOC129750939 [Uranotaenia lowii]|uniref:uncharacterized protein LOC129750939 n=1 Tax=Uranotaenia lowii TaxID=190385 RepID=UPI0024799604|nr:uncharacterized protein LOC129750939 [Uranotaenia lowii]